MSVINECVEFWMGLPGETVHATTLAAGQKIYQGTLGVEIAGKLYSLAPQLRNLTSLMLTVPGADGNGGLNLYSLQTNVRYQALAGTSKTFGITVAYAANTITFVVQLATDGGGLVTSTANDVVNGLVAHALANKYLRVQATGTGAGLAALIAATAIPQFKVLGFAEKTYDNAAGVSDVLDEYRFIQGIARLTALASDPVTPAMIGSNVAIYDEVTVRATPNSLDYTIPLIDISTTGSIFCDISGKRRV